MSPIAIGILVEPELKEFIKLEDSGKKYPIATPISIAKNIHKVRKRSRNASFFISFLDYYLFNFTENI